MNLFKKIPQKEIFLGKFAKFMFLSLVLSINSTQALSFKEYFAEKLGILNASSTEEDYDREENVQKLKVFEANKSVNSISFDENLPVSDLNNNNLTLEVGKDNFEADEEFAEGHSDNAIYKVQKGDTIYSIAAYFGVSVDTVLSFNKKTSKIVSVGEILEVPSEPGVLYEIKKGDTLAKISKKYTIEIDDITLYNGLLASDELAVGEEIFLPGAVEKAASIKDVKKPATKTKGNIAKTDTSLLKYKPSTWARGDTSHLNSLSDIKKYSSLPKYPGYYMYPAPGTVRTQKMHGHNSADFAGKIGTPIVASAAGTVRVAKSGGYNFGYGNYVIITHDNGTETVYAHMSKVTVSPGQRVSGGQAIGALGSSGNSTGPHLHFEIRGAYNQWAW